VLEDDDEFRARVARAATEESVGRASWLWLHRPDGWEEELDEMLASASASAVTARELQEERSARRRLVAAEEARRRADASAAVAQEAAAKAAEELAAERRARREAEERVALLRSEVAEAQTAAAIAAAAAERAELEAADLRATVADLVAERDQLEKSSPAPDTPGRNVAVALAGAAAAASQLGVALTAASEALGFSVAADPTPTPPPAPVRARRPARPAPRRPAPLPPATFEDSIEAADYLVRVSGMVLLVDGYNVSLRAWPDLATPTQRRRLTDALTELAARTGVDARIVFDGAEQPEPGPRDLPVRSPVRVYFSPPDVDADEVLIELVEQLPANRPVVVATSDRRVQTEVRRRGANVISSQRLLDLLGRARARRA